MINIYINIAMVGSVNQVLWDLLTRIKQSGLYDSANKIYLVFNGDRKQLSFNLVSEKYSESYWASQAQWKREDVIWRKEYEGVLSK